MLGDFFGLPRESKYLGSVSIFTRTKYLSKRGVAVAHSSIDGESLKLCFLLAGLFDQIETKNRVCCGGS